MIKRITVIFLLLLIQNSFSQDSLNTKINDSINITTPQNNLETVKTAEKQKAYSADSALYGAELRTDTLRSANAPKINPDLEIIKIADVKCPPEMVGVKYKGGLFNLAQKKFCIDIYEFPNIPGKFPVVSQNWYEASNICKERGKRLCSDKEWVSACKGIKGKNKYGYGINYESDRCNTNSEYFVKTGANPRCISEYGVYDMSGNVSEWTDGGGIVSYGGNYDSGNSAKCSEWEPHNLDGAYQNVGFRCCIDATE